MKSTNLSQIPGLKYKNDRELNPLPRPSEWNDRAITESVLGSIQLKKVRREPLIPAKDQELQHKATSLNPFW